ncbi:MAG: hypothetical protein CVV24_08790 [Ignavibacteriae bacterium HGW-Ignavibacteriae-3]|nr:MAG: hypothetical protein CVV24_08790 [Ignavibacteriae bacterium HGW-Ignavibacteriae-3]
MFKSALLAALITALLFLNKVKAQEAYSIQLNGGIISPRNSTNGFTALLQFDYPLSSDIVFYVYSGYASWGQDKIAYLEDYSLIQRQTIFNSYSSDGHSLIPVYVGSRINLKEIKLFTAFVTVEMGFALLTYDSYTNIKNINPLTGEVLSYVVDRSSKNEIDENLFGLGLGGGLNHRLTRNLDLIFSVKLNSHLNSKYYDFFSSKRTYAVFIAGLCFKI